MGDTSPGQEKARSTPASSVASSVASAAASAAASSAASSVAPSSASSIGIDIGGTKTLGVLLAADGSILARSLQPTPTGGNRPVEEAVLAMIATLLGEARALGSSPGGIGIGAPGYVDSARGLILDASNLRVLDLPLGDAVRSRFHLPTLVVHDVKAATTAEAALGAGQGLEHFAYLNIGTGIAAGFVLNGVLFEGEEGRAGEIGHVVLRSDGPACSCGKRGCLEVLASGSALAAQAEAAVQRYPGSLLALLAADEEAGGTNKLSGVRLLARAAEAGDPYAIDLLDSAAAYLGQAAAWLVDTLGLQRVVLGGGVVQVGEALLGPLRRIAVDSMLEANRADGVVESSTLGTDGGAIGAALAGRAQHLRVQEVTCSE